MCPKLKQCLPPLKQEHKQLGLFMNFDMGCKACGRCEILWQISRNSKKKNHSEAKTSGELRNLNVSYCFVIIFSRKSFNNSVCLRIFLESLFEAKHFACYTMGKHQNENNLSSKIDYIQRWSMLGLCNNGATTVESINVSNFSGA
jgi:hypothetical protein